MRDAAVAFSALSVISIEVDGLRVRLERRPHPEHREEIPGRRRKRRARGVIARALGLRRLGIDQRDAEAFRRELGERERERAPDEAAAGDQTSTSSRSRCLASACPAMPRSAGCVNLLKGGAEQSEGLAHEPRARSSFSPSSTSSSSR